MSEDRLEKIERLLTETGRVGSRDAEWIINELKTARSNADGWEYAHDELNDIVKSHGLIIGIDPDGGFCLTGAKCETETNRLRIALRSLWLDDRIDTPGQTFDEFVNEYAATPTEAKQ